MAVPETSPPVRVVHNSMQMLAQTVVKVDGIHRAVVGRFRHPNTSDVLLAKETSLLLASANDEGSLTTHHTQPLHATILNLQVLRAQQQATASQELDKLVLLTTSGNLSIIKFDVTLYRFVSLSQIPLVPAGRQGLLPAQALQVEPCGHAIAISGYNWVALMPTAVATQTPLEDSPILAVLPSFLSSSIHSPRQKAPAPPGPTGPDSPVDVPITASSAPSPSRSYTCDEAWLRAQTDTCRLDAMWMASDLSSIQDLVQDQEEHMSAASPLTSMPPSGLIRSICFVEIPGKQNSLALAVLYYVAPDSGFTLDILQWKPQDKTLSVRYRLQLHELADMFDFLLGSLVLDMCTVRNCQSGLVLLFETGLVLFDLADIVDGGPNTPAGTVLHQNRVRCHSFAKGSSQSAIASVGVVYGANWPTGTHTPSHVAPDPAELSIPSTAADEQPAGRSGPFGAQNSPRLLTSGCWRERLSPAFSAYPPSAEPAELHQELLLGFDVCEGFEHSVLSMVVKRKLAREGAGSGWFADLQDTKFRPGSTPTSMLSLSNNHVLLGCETGDGCIARLPTPSPGGPAGGPLALGPLVTSTLHNAAPVWAFTVANLQRLPQDQVYAACGDSSSGSIRVIQADQTVEVLYESPADYPGISGMWSIPPWPGADFHSLLVLSFASGSRAMATGSTLRDVTDGVGLVANERTLACACLADRLLLQVMHKRMQLFTMDAALAPDQGELSCSPSGDRSRARLGEHLTLEDLEISTPDDHMPGDQRQAAEEAQIGWGHASRGPIPAPSSSHPIATSDPEVWRGGEDVWMAPGGASISTAAAADGTVVASCTHFKGLAAVQAVLAEEGSGGRPWVAGAVAQSPGKRKRGRRRWCLQETARVALQHEVSCIHLLPYPQGGRGCKLVAAGTYKPGLQLLMLQTGDSSQGTSQQPCFLPFASVAITPLMHQTFQGGAAAAPEEPPGSPRKALPDQAIPESVQILPLLSRHDDVQVLLGLRNGTMLQLTAQQTHSPAQPPHADPFQHPTPAVSHSHGSGPRAPQLQTQPPQLQLAAVKHLGSLPVVLIPLPTAAGLKGSSLALSDRMALLSCAPGTGRAVASHLAVAGVTHAVPLWQPATSAPAIFHSRFTVLCASSSGRLQLLDLQHQEHPNMRSLPMLPPARPVHLTVHPSKAVLVVACQGSDKLWEMRCMHPATGATLARYPLQAGECVSGICMWQRPARPAARKPSARATPLFTAPGEANEEGGNPSTSEAAMPNPEVKAPEAQEEEGAATSMAEAKPEEEEGLEAGMAGPKAAEEDEAKILSQADEEEDEVFVVVGTGEGLKGSGWSPCKGRLLLIQLAKSGSTHKGLWLHTVAELKFADQVHAVAVLPSCAPKSGQAAEGVIVAAVGRRLVAFSEQHGQLQKHHLTATAQPVTCLSPDGDTGRFVASNEMDSVMAYDFKADSGFRMMHADRHSRPISHCAAIQNPTPSQATIAAVDQKGRAIFMAPEPETYGPERNMYTAVQYHLGQAPAGIVEGNLRQRPRDDDFNAEPSQTASASSSFSNHQGSPGLSLSALPEFGRDAPREGGGAEQSGVGFIVGPAVHPPQTSGRPQGMSSGQEAIGHNRRKADEGRAIKGSSWVTVTTAGDVMQLISMSEEQHKLLADLQHVMVKEAATAPLSGCNLEHYRAARDSPGRGRQHPAKGPHIALDGDLLAQFLHLPATLQQRLVSAMLEHQAVKQASKGTQAGQQPLVSLPILTWALEGTLPIC